MSSIITVILKSAVGLLGNKARDKTVAKLRRDVTDAQVREIVVRELNDIKTKLDGISRKDLLSSFSFLREGIELVNVSLDRSTQEDRCESSAMPSDAASTRLNETLELTRTVENIKSCAQYQYEFAKERFRSARKKATEAFCNEALKTDERIFAAKLRIASEILENLESPETAVTGCLSCLRDLHNLPAIRDTFSVYLNGGCKSFWGKQERAENVKSVMMINSALFQFLFKFGSKRTDRLNWPAGTIELTDRSFNTILEWHKISSRKSMEGELGERPNKLVLDKSNEILFPRLSAVNSHGHIIVRHGDDEIKIISSAGQTKVVKLRVKGKFVHQRISTIAVDKDNVIHVVSILKTRTETHGVSSYVLNVLDESYNCKHVCSLDFLEEHSDRYPTMDMAINKNNDIILTRNNNRSVYVCGNSGKLKHKFERDTSSLLMLSISHKNEIMIPTDRGKALNFYTEEGNLTSTIKVPEGHSVLSMAFHYFLGKIIVLTRVEEMESRYLLCYSEAGELHSTTFFSLARELPSITSHPAGPVAVVKEKSITYI